MFDYRISKHPHFNEACRAFALRHNMAKLAECAEMNVQTLRNKLNPEQPHQLTAPDIWLLTDLTEDSTLVTAKLRRSAPRSCPLAPPRKWQPVRQMPWCGSCPLPPCRAKAFLQAWTC